jgi:hypothetical protein
MDHAALESIPAGELPYDVELNLLKNIKGIKR